MAQLRVLNDALSIASPYMIANNDLLGIVEPRDASRVSIFGFFHAIHQVMRSMMITGFAMCLCSYLLRRELKVTSMLGRNNARRSVLMVPTSSRAKSNMTDVFG